MLNNSDLYKYTFTDLISFNDGTTPFSNVILVSTYEVRKYQDIRNLANTNAYQIFCTHRTLAAPNTQFVPGIQTGVTSLSYPGALTNNLMLVNSNSSSPNTVKAELISYFPKTINAAVTSTSNQGTSSDNSTTYQHTSGSSMSQSNTYGVSAGIQGDMPTFGVSADFSHSHETNNSLTQGNDKGGSISSSTDTSMSVKDWACYSSITSDSTQSCVSGVTWTWGQEYPWDVIKYCYYDSTTNSLPYQVATLLTDGTNALPPSQLSQFGLDFIMRTKWIIQSVNIPSASVSSGTFTPSTLYIRNIINYYEATHTVSTAATSTTAATVTGSITTLTAEKNNDGDSENIIFHSLDVALLALDPISTGAATGFITNQFTILPNTTAGNYFEIASTSNNLLVRGLGFDAPTSVFTAKGVASLQIYFKLTNSNAEYTLFLKCWNMTASANSVLTITINPSGSNTVITKNITDVEFGGGEDNLVAISLRNKNYTSADYHDYLQYGVNEINISITPGNSNSFALRTLAISRD